MAHLNKFLGGLSCPGSQESLESLCLLLLLRRPLAARTHRHPGGASAVSWVRRHEQADSSRSIIGPDPDDKDCFESDFFVCVFDCFLQEVYCPSQKVRKFESYTVALPHELKKKTLGCIFASRF